MQHAEAWPWLSVEQRFSPWSIRRRWAIATSSLPAARLITVEFSYFSVAAIYVDISATLHQQFSNLRVPVRLTLCVRVSEDCPAGCSHLRHYLAAAATCQNLRKVMIDLMGPSPGFRVHSCWPFAYNKTEAGVGMSQCEI